MPLLLLLLALSIPSVAVRSVAYAQASVPSAPAPLSPPEPPVGSCIGGACGTAPPAAASRTRSGPKPFRAAGSLASAGAVFGTVSAGLVLGGALTIALLDAPASERVTRGVWLGYSALATPLVALTSWLARREGAFAGYRRARRLGWLSYGLALSDGALLWYGAFHDFRGFAGLTIFAGALGAIALLPHALDALAAARHLRSRRFRVAFAPGGLGVRF